MLYYNKILFNKIYYISLSLLSLFIIYGCRYDNTVHDHQEQKYEGLNDILANPILITLASTRYYILMGKWPNSTYDFEQLNEKPFSEIDWASLHDTIVFEKLPDGRLKITSTEPDFHYSTTLQIPTKKSYK